MKLGDCRFPCRMSISLSVLLSVCLSVHSLSVYSVFRIFLSHPLRYRLDILYKNLSWHNTDQVRGSSRLTYFYRSYCHLLKVSFPDFSLLRNLVINLNGRWHSMNSLHNKTLLIIFYFLIVTMMWFWVACQAKRHIGIILSGVSVRVSVCQSGSHFPGSRTSLCFAGDTCNCCRILIPCRHDNWTVHL